ncbi:MAG: aminotransferase class I/II-fold pyridoxal phosphate-dependent enzyme [Chitinophagaceae bacterium]|jgi:8-amino-7-oxononanoate synthase|nr:aminotransferase class I/II-fold pyridoxal phosphate-dependent enzyme [Chitinophagaceae bacterium]
MITVSQIPGRTTLINNEEYLFFSGYSYLGLGMNQTFTDLVKKGIDLYGVVYPSSRISNTQLDLYTDFEQKLANYTSSQAAACFSSGFLSARTATEVVCKQMQVYCMHHTHPASSATHQLKKIPETQSWDAFLQEREEQREFTFGLVADSINPTPGHINDFSFLHSTPAAFNITLIIDDSHGIGWLGNKGEGICSTLSLPPNVELLLNFSLSKAFHINGGAVCGSKKWIDEVRQHVNFTTSTPMMPSLVYAWLNSEQLFLEQRLKLIENIEYLLKLLTNNTFVANEGTPVFVADKKGIASELLQQKLIISSFAYPHPYSNPVNRVVLNALHLKSDLEKLALLLGSKK